VSGKKKRRYVHVVSHGPHCLDGVTAAVVVSRYRRGATVLPRFSSNAEIDQTLRELSCEASDGEHEVWITDISWTDPAVDRHLQSLLDRGVRVYWIDHHRSALRRAARGEVKVDLTARVLSEAFAASRLVYDFVCDRARSEGGASPVLTKLQRLVAMADDNDRWVHAIQGSRDLALVVGAMQGTEAYDDLMRIDASVTFTPRMQAALERARSEIKHSLTLAEGSRVERQIDAAKVRLVVAVCDGYPSEVAAHWGTLASEETVFALYDMRSQSVSLRRSPDCRLDLSRIAQHLGGGGHAAAAGATADALRRSFAECTAFLVASATEMVAREDSTARAGTPYSKQWFQPKGS
jgi:oligoribonuclease NrnB/cAMP/cGMP phosphodiesterase (DHH superfamily)